MRGHSPKLHQRRFRWDMRREFYTDETLEWAAQGAVESLAVYKERLDVALSAAGQLSRWCSAMG